MTELYPNYMNNDYKRSPDDTQLYGWHLCSRSSVATNAKEKPHNSGWTCLLECEIDMAYSPLMKLNVGKEAITWYSLYLADNATQDPVVAIIAKRLIIILKQLYQK